MSHTSSLPAVAGLVALVGAAGTAAMSAGVAIGAVASLAAVFIVVDLIISPHVIEWIVPARTLERDGDNYLATNDLERRLAPIVGRRCADAGLPLVKVGIVDDGMPTAFTFGRSPRSARLWVSRGLFARLDDDELDAVVCHELGHVKHWDVLLMTVAALVPLVLYRSAMMLMDSDDDDGEGDGALLGIVVLVAYAISELLLLGLSRSREYKADRWSCECTANGDALASALVTIGFGIGAERAARDAERNAPTPPPAGSKEARQVQRRRSGVESTMVLGITNARSAASPRAVAPLGDVDRAVDAMRWEVANPWAAVLEKLSTHPLVARRIQALEESGLPGAPRRWSIARSLASIVPHDRRSVRRAAVADGALAISPWLLLIAAVAIGAGFQSRLSVGLALVTAGGLLLAKQARKYPDDFAPSEVTPLLGRLDASPVAGIPVELRGELIGRADAGNLLSPDLVLQDSTGFVPLARFSLVPLAGTAFALTQAESLLGSEVVARGWYRRTPTPIVELRELSTVGGDQSTRTWWWRACWVCSAGVLAAGLLVSLASAF